MRIIIAMDVIDGKCVRLTKGDYSTTRIYSTNPLDIARQAEDHGFKYLHMVDLDGAREKKIVNHRILKEISANTSLKIDFGGGIRTTSDLRLLFDYGADQVTIGSISVTNEALFMQWLDMFGPEKIILGADSHDRRVYSGAWMDNNEIDILKFISDYKVRGVKYALCTDIEKDGMLSGPSFELYREILKIPGINLIASGGISTVEDVERLAEIGCEGAVIGKALYEGMLNLKDLSRLC
ncbi:MAG: 1-(5-phosphoribosyl)-5-[(5-phosphoribosylamino)methylideneamino]imidazole-4-carboxamide isomerase [Bacteroidales bacterium]|nr:1-(5-phosphoribosyl)-5-[(5-phosphoribosylamino)methylideneamino]imidazole-4-carboxamide isomerase [Bacteroidales bacterium]